MCRIKNYISYLERIENYAESINVKIVRKPDYSGDGAFVPTRNTVIIDDNMSESKEIATLLHELGHVLHFSMMTDEETANQNIVYTHIYKKRCSKKHKTAAVRFEKKAWEYGRVIARLLKIRLGEWYNVEVTESIKSYKA